MRKLLSIKTPTYPSIVLQTAFNHQISLITGTRETYLLDNYFSKKMSYFLLSFFVCCTVKTLCIVCDVLLGSHFCGSRFEPS